MVPPPSAATASVVAPQGATHNGPSVDAVAVAAPGLLPHEWGRLLLALPAPSRWLLRQLLAWAGQSVVGKWVLALHVPHGSPLSRSRHLGPEPVKGYRTVVAVGRAIAAATAVSGALAPPAAELCETLVADVENVNHAVGSSHRQRPVTR